MLYRKIEQAIREHAPSVSVPIRTTRQDVYQCIRDILRDHPDIFWFSHQWQYTEEDNIVHFSYTINKKYSDKAKGQIDDVIQNDFGIDSVLRLSVPEQVMCVYKWLALYCAYNIYSAYNQTMYSVFVCRNSVCTGYAKAAQYLFKLLGIESKLLFGTLHNAEEGSRHCWLLVKINDLWYHFDPTLAVPEIKILLYKAGVEPIFGAKGLIYNYFCCDTAIIKQSRVIEDENELPECNSCLPFESLQNIPIKVHRDSMQSESQGVKGCLLSDRGKFANVYLWHSDDGTQKVVKTYKTGTSAEMLFHEYHVMCLLSSFSSVLHTTGTTVNQDGIIIEQATPLADLLCCHYYQLSAVDFCKLLLDVLTGLQNCLEQGIYYRDIHQNNIYRTSRGHYVLGDFGSCVFVKDKKPLGVSGVASPWYSAPETFLNEEFNEASATYGVGMLAYFLLNELFPPLWNEFGKSSLNLRVKGAKLPPPILLKKPSCAFEQRMEAVITKSLSYKTADRFQKLTDLKAAIINCMSLIEDNYILIIGSSSKSGEKFDRLDNEGNPVPSIPIDFQSNDEGFPGIVVSNEPNDLVDIDSNTNIEIVDDPDDGDMQPDVLWGNDCTDDFATTGAGIIAPMRKPSTTYQPKYEDVKQLEMSFWQQLFRRKEKQDVYGSVFAPSEVKSKSHLIVQVYLHLQEEVDLVKQLAIESDKNAERRDYLPLQCKLKKGDKVDVSLNIYADKLLMSDNKSVIWRGNFTKCSFDYYVDTDVDTDLSCMVMLTVNNIPIGEMRFITKVVGKPRQLNPEVFSKQYHKIFISYAHQDEPQVEPMARAYKAQGVEYFFDRHYLKPGDIFPLKIQEFIESADLFILCWSANAAQSKYVQLEREHALKRAFPKVKPFESAPLRIYPMMIEPHAEMPDDMRDTFNFEVVFSGKK